MLVGVCSIAVSVMSLSYEHGTNDVAVPWPPIASTTAFIALLIVAAVVRLRDYFVYQVIEVLDD